MEMVKDVCQAILKSVGQVHVLVNNAGLALGLTAYQNYEEWDLLTMLDTNVKGLMMMTRQILPSMVAANEGHIINMGSTAGIYAYAAPLFIQQPKLQWKLLVTACVLIPLPQISR